MCSEGSGLQCTEQDGWPAVRTLLAVLHRCSFPPSPPIPLPELRRSLSFNILNEFILLSFVLRWNDHGPPGNPWQGPSRFVSNLCSAQKSMCDTEKWSGLWCAARMVFDPRFSTVLPLSWPHTLVQICCLPGCLCHFYKSSVLTLQRISMWLYLLLIYLWDKSNIINQSIVCWTLSLNLWIMTGLTHWIQQVIDGELIASWLVTLICLPILS